MDNLLENNSEEYFSVFDENSSESTEDTQPEENVQPNSSVKEESLNEGQEKEETSTEKTPINFQSEYDKLKKEYGVLQREQERYKDYNQIAEFLYRNPQSLEKLEQQLRAAPQEAPIEPEEAPPSMPKKPENYNIFEAKNEPGSESAKYDQSLIEYNANMVNYLLNRDLKREKNQQQMLQEQKEAALKQERQSQLEKELVSKGLSSQEVEDFYNVMNSTASLDPKNMIAYYRMLKGQNSGLSQKDIAEQQFNEQKKRMSDNPPPPAEMGESGTKPLSEEELFNQSLLNYRR